jgi:phosphonatase-like hydrolase
MPEEEIFSIKYRMEIALVVFVIAGTTVQDNNEVGDAFQAALNHFGYEVPIGQINPYMGYEKHEAIRKILATDQREDVLVDEAHIAEIHQYFVENMVRYYETSASIAPLPNAEETFARLHGSGIRVAINTGFSRNIADVILKKLGWLERGLIDDVIASDEVERGRPFPDMIQKLMANAGITDPMTVAKVGDTEVDINEGKNVGCRYVIGVTTGAYSRADLEPYHPTHIIDDLQELTGIIHA